VINLYNMDCMEFMATQPDNSIDAVITDPPYGLSFMGKKWDYDVPSVEVWRECLRVLKPGGHLLSFAGTRTYHRMACAIEDAGFEVRNMLCWTYASGFPKSLNLSKQLSKQTGIGLCTCKAHEPMIELEYEKNNKQRDNISNGDNDGLGFGEQVWSQGNDDNEVAEQNENTNISSNGTIRKESEVCKLSEDNNQKKQGHKEVGESILQSGMCKSIPEKEGYGSSAIRSGLEESQTTSEREGQGLPNMQNKAEDGVGGSSPNSVQNGRQKLNGKSGGSLSELPQQDRKDNGKRNRESENDRKIREWKIEDRFICSKCRKIKSDIGGTALKPAIEPICMAMKPLSEKNFVSNVLNGELVE